MKPDPSLLKLLASLPDRIKGVLLLSVAVPLLVLAAFGTYAVVALGYWRPFLLALVITSALTLLPLAYRRLRLRFAPKPVSRPLPRSTAFESLERQPPNHWTPTDHRILADIRPELFTLARQSTGWESLPDLGLSLLRQVAVRYHGDKTYAEWSFSPTEVLAITEHLSRRYRQILRDNVPFVEHIKLRHLMLLHDSSDYIGRGTRLYGLYRKIRMVTPEGIIAELRSQLLDKVFDGVADDLQQKVKFLLLQETLHTAIDLYGGHFRFEDQDLAISHAGQHDQTHQAPPLEPVRIVLLGQVSAGKSSLVNTLIEQTRAEVSALPSTDALAVYRFQVSGETLFNLVDLPGLNGDPDVEKHLLREVARSDIVLWVLKANQPARKLDQQFREKLEQYFAGKANTTRRPPLVVGILNQVDRLGRPDDWAPPYDLLHGDGKAALIREALDYNREVLGLDTLLPLSIAPGKTQFNVEELASTLKERYDKALQVQLSRRRQEAGEMSWQSVKKQGERLKSLAGKAWGWVRA